MSFRVVDEDVVDGDAGPAGAAGEPAFVLAAGVSYVRGWSDAERAAEVLRRELRVWGIDGRMAVRADVTAAGVGVVELGWVTPELAELLAGLLAQVRGQAVTPAAVSGRAPRAA